MKSLKSFSIALMTGVALSMVATVAVAQTPGPAGGGGQDLEMLKKLELLEKEMNGGRTKEDADGAKKWLGDAKQMVAVPAAAPIRAVSKVIEGLQKNPNVFVPTGTTFLAMALLLAIITGGYQLWVSGAAVNDAVAGGVRLAITTSVPLYMLNDWGGLMNTFQSYFTFDLPQVILTGAAGFKNPADMVETALISLNAATYSKLPDASILHLGDTLASWLIMLLVWILNAILGFAVAFAVFMPMAAMAIGAVCGPLLVAWLPFEKTADLFSAWFKFMLSNGVAVVVSVVIVGGMGEALQAVAADTSKTLSNGGMIIGVSQIVVMLMVSYLFLTNLLLSANNIASGMVGGMALGSGIFAGKAGAAVMKAAKMKEKPDGKSTPTPTAPAAPSGGPKPMDPSRGLPAPSTPMNIMDPSRGLKGPSGGGALPGFEKGGGSGGGGGGKGGGSGGGNVFDMSYNRKTNVYEM